MDTVTILMSDLNVAVWFNDFMLEIQFRRRYDAKKSWSIVLPIPVEYVVGLELYSYW